MGNAKNNTIVLNVYARDNTKRWRIFIGDNGKVAVVHDTLFDEIYHLHLICIIIVQIEG